jgi:endoglucanase
MNRRTFLRTTAASTTLVAAHAWPGSAAELKPASAKKLPRWRGFNLLEKFIKQSNGNPPFQERDFILMSEWGFDFVRLPLSYHCWASAEPSRWLEIREGEIVHIDEAVEFGRKYGVHVNINFHRAPGYCVNPPAESLDLWTNADALAAAAHHWAYFAKRYKGISNARVSFDLLNEPPDIPEETYVRVIKHLVSAIRAIDPERLIIVDGRKWGREPVHPLADQGVAQSTRGYDPMRISHWKANWVKGANQWPEPTWPLQEDKKSVWNKDRLRRERIEPWKKLEARGVGIHVGEWGPFNKTPHGVALAWMRDQLELWQEAGWGWAMWNFRGAFGPLNSGRTDVKYETVQGLQLDKSMLELLRKH